MAHEVKRRMKNSEIRLFMKQKKAADRALANQFFAELITTRKTLRTYQSSDHIKWYEFFLICCFCNNPFLLKACWQGNAFSAFGMYHLPN